MGKKLKIKIFHNIAPYHKIETQFVRLVLKFRSRSLRKSPNKLLPPDDRRPTFWEVVQEVLSGVKDEHWNPWSHMCGLCSLHYDFILKYENFQEELHLFLKTTAMEALWREDLRAHRIQGEDRRDRVLKYMQVVPLESFQALERLYRQDILLGGYSQDVAALKERLYFSKDIAN